MLWLVPDECFDLYLMNVVQRFYYDILHTFTCCNIRSLQQSHRTIWILYFVFLIKY
jgi:hypothetical protein